MDKDLSAAINRQAHAIANMMQLQLQLREDLRALAFDLLDQGNSPAQVADALRREGAGASQYTLYRRGLGD